MRIPTLFARTTRATGLLAAVLWLAPAAGAQDGPFVTITPATTTLSQPAVPVRFRAWDALANNPATPVVKQDGNVVTGDWNVVYKDSLHGVFGQIRIFTGARVVTLSAAQPQRTVEVTLCHPTDVCDTGTAVYTLGGPGVVVTPDGAVSSETPSPTRAASFTVQNTGSASASFALTASCRDEDGDVVSPCTPSASSVTVAAGASGAVTVLYPSAAVGQLVSITLEAAQQGVPGVRDAGWRDVAVYGTAGTAESNPLVAIAPMNAGTAVERSQCVTVATAAGGAYECGDLRAAHPLPPHRTRGRAWAPTLVYNSQLAHPRPIVYADVTLPAGAQTPSWVDVKVILAAGTAHTARYDGAVFTPGMPRRVAVQWDGLSYGTNVYAYSLEVTARYSSGTLRTTTEPGELAIVNRSGSAFGAGWWVAGWEQILCVTCGQSGAPQRMLWIGGDGSTRMYEPLAAASTWEAKNADGAPDTLRLVTEGGITFYERRLPGGVEVHLDGNGQHFRTVNRLGQTTTFIIQSYRLTGIYAPTPTAAVTPAWLFAYNTSNRLATVTATTQTAPARVVTLGYGLGDARVTSIQDPDGVSAGFGYTGTDRRIVRQRNRRGTDVFYAYDATGKLSSARVQMGTAANPEVDPTTTFSVAESRGVAQAGSQYGAASAFVGYVTTVINGPRADVADITTLWLTPRGAVRRARDPVGAESFVEFGDARFPALPTQVTAPNGAISRARYDFRGRVDSMTLVNPLGDGRDVMTRVAYDDRWDAPISVRTYGVASGVATALAGASYTQYDATTGNVVWQQQGDSTARRVNFTYYPTGHAAAGQLESVTTPAPGPGGTAAVERVFYDAVGNLKMTMSPLRFVTLHVRDGQGRDSIVYTPIAADTTGRDTSMLKVAGARVHTTYDAMGRVVHARSVGPATTHTPTTTFHPAATPQEEVEVATTFDAGGLPLEVSRWSEPDSALIGNVRTEFEYDAMGRKIRERSPPDGNRTFQYDLAGNVTVETTPLNQQITMQYDALGRPTRRVVPVASFARVYDQMWTVAGNEPFPRFPNDGTGFTVPEEWSYWRYDRAGNMVHAENGDAIVQRTYFPNGVLKTDSTRLRSYDWTTYTDVYGLSYTYDLLGRATSMQHPTNLAGTAHTDAYAYDPVTGALSGLTDRRGNAFAFRYDLLGRTRAITMPGSVVDSMQYDLEGRLTWRYEGGVSSGVLQNETMQHDARGKLLHTSNGQAQFRNWYTGLGMLAANDWQDINQDIAHISEELPGDPLGNVFRRRTSQGSEGLTESQYPNFLTRYGPGTSRVTYIHKRPPPTPSTSWSQDSTAYGYDAAGQQVRSHQIVGQNVGGELIVGREAETRSYYGPDGRLRALQRYEQRYKGSDSFGTELYDAAGVWEEYRYDPLGRRILVSTRQDGGICTQPGSWSCITSTTRFVWAGDQLLWELKTPQGTAPPASGGNVSYTHGGVIDRPLVITKGDTSIVTHQNWRGQFARGTYGVTLGRTLGAKSDCTSYPAVGCTSIPWPGERTTVRHELAEEGDFQNWFGGLVDGMRDESGLQYMRNRYYDPQSGQFTQPDPIGLRGGVNAYGFAAGDPISYRDPYGLKVCFNGTSTERRGLERQTEQAIGATLDVGIDGCVTRVGASGSPARGEFNDLVRSNRTFTMAYSTQGSYFNPVTKEIGIDESEQYLPFYAMEDGECRPAVGTFDFVERIIAHELGHAYDYDQRGTLLRILWRGRRRRERYAMRWENLWARQHNQPERCRYGAEF